MTADSKKVGDLRQTSCTLPAGPLKVGILVHHRGIDPVDGANLENDASSLERPEGEECCEVSLRISP
jgi:hypothetical protein